MSFDLGRIRPKWRGVYSPSTTYIKNDLVGFEGSSYRCLQESTGNEPSDPFYWELVAKGSDQLTTKGDLLFHDGTNTVPLSIGMENQFLGVENGLPVWRSQQGRPGATVKKLFKGSLSSHHCFFGIMDDGTVMSCGQGEYYFNGDADAKNTFIPQPVPFDPDNPPTTPIKDVIVGHKHAFALTEDGVVYSWGCNTAGQLGHGDTIARSYATRIDWFVDNGIQIKEVFVPEFGIYTNSTTYFIATTGELYACGENGYGQCGIGTNVDQYLPVQCGALSGVKQVSASVSHYVSVMVIDGNGDLWGWGLNNHGELGLGDTATYYSPQKVTNLASVKKIIVAGGDATAAGDQIYAHSIALLENGKVFVTGYNGDGQLGLGDTTQRTSFQEVSGSMPPAKDIFASCSPYATSGMIDENDNLWFWGYNGYGQLGLGDTTSRTGPVLLSETFQGKVKKVLIGGTHSYHFVVVLDTDGAVWGAGYSDWGQLGRCNGHIPSNPTFEKFRNSMEHIGIKFIDIMVNGHSLKGTTYGLTEDGRVFATGNNEFGQCGTHPTNIHTVDALYTMLF